MRKVGRPTKKNDQVIDRIISGLSKGTPLAVICRESGMPSPSTVWNWTQADPAISDAIARARDAGFDAIALEALRIADTPIMGEEITESKDGPTIKRADMIAHRKLQVETRLKLLAKWDPKRYGDKPDITITNNVAAVANGEEVKPRSNTQIEEFRKRWERAQNLSHRLN